MLNQVEQVKKILDRFMRDPHSTYPSPKTAELAKEIDDYYRQLFEQRLTPSMKFELEGMKPEYQDRLSELLNFVSAMGDYGDPHGLLAVISPTSGKVLRVEGNKIIPEQQPDEGRLLIEGEYSQAIKDAEIRNELNRLEPYIKQVVDCDKFKDGDALIDPVGLAALDYWFKELKAKYSPTKEGGNEESKMSEVQVQG